MAKLVLTPDDESRCSPHELGELLAWERANIPDIDLAYRVDVDTATFEVTVHRFLEDRPGSGRVAVGPEGEIGYADPVTFVVPALPPPGPWWGRATDA